jgi:membrane dipeptidase
MKFIFDAHLDLSMNALEWNRDLTKSIREIRKREVNLFDKPDRGKATVSLPELRKGNIGLFVATLIARYVKLENKLPGWNSPEQAWAHTQGQYAWYKAMEEKGEMIQIFDLNSLEKHLKKWNNDLINPPLGFILSLEGADSIVNLNYLNKLHEQGLRAIGPAHYGPGTYAFGTDSNGGIGNKGRELLKEIEKLNLILDVTHLCDQSLKETMAFYKGKLWASHSNCRSLVPNKRQFSDDQIKQLVDRGAVIGMVFDAWMMIPNWSKGITNPEKSGLIIENIVDHIDHICQLTGNTNHIGIGSDLDGGFGKEQCPFDIDTIADLQRLDLILKNRGYTDEDTEKIFNKNFIDFLKKNIS